MQFGDISNTLRTKGTIRASHRGKQGVVFVWRRFQHGPTGGDWVVTEQAQGCDRPTDHADLGESAAFSLYQTYVGRYL